MGTGPPEERKDTKMSYVMKDGREQMRERTQGRQNERESANGKVMTDKMVKRESGKRSERP